MHTFFVNTSGRELERYSDIFEIQHETRKLVSMECPLAEWSNHEKGFKPCAQKMGEMIDNYKDINNDFNLILYVDLLSLKEYAAIPMNRHRDRYACLKALHSITKQYIKNTLIEELYEAGRVPKEILLIFEENSQPEDRDERTEEGKNLIRSYAHMALGLPVLDEIVAILHGDADKADGVKITPEEFCDKVAKTGKSCLDEKIIYSYMDLVDTFISEMEGYETPEEPLKRLLDRIVECADEDDDAVFSVSFETDRRSSETNKQINAQRNLQLCFYVFECVEEETVLDKFMPYEDEKPNVKRFSDIDWEKVAAELYAKKCAYNRKLYEIKRLSDSYAELKLAPVLYSLDEDRFALDEYGKRKKELRVTEIDEVRDDEQLTKDIEEGVVRPTGKKNVVVNNAGRRAMFSREEYLPFDYRWDDYDKSILGSKANPEQYVAEAKKLRQHHLNYLQSLKMHVLDRMSNYAGRSQENDPALLRKRNVSVKEDGFEDEGRDYRYAEPGRNEETKKINTVASVSETAYMSALLEYMEFCAARSIAVTDIEEQCNWFVTRIHQINTSLKKIQLVVIGLLFATIILYLPFVVLQWEAIIKNTMTVLVALLSIAIPLALVYVNFIIVSMVQRKKYRKVWKEFKEKSDQVLMRNALSAEKYDQLLMIYIPTLRWVYEYKLDVEFYFECCRKASAKINHHNQKVKERITAIANIIEDLEMDGECKEAEDEVRKNSIEEIDYNAAFCSGKANKKFYSIIDLQLLNAVHK